jgi:Protein of unknown function (DUF2612)
MAVTTLALLNLSGQITVTGAARVAGAFPLNLAGRIKAISTSKVAPALPLVGGRTKATISARAPNVAPLAGRIGAVSAARARQTAPLAGRLRATSALKVTPYWPLSGRIGLYTSARSSGTSPALFPCRATITVGARADPLYLPRAFAGRVKTTTGVRGAAFIMPALRGRIKATAGIRAATNVTPRNLAGRIKATSTIRAGASINLSGRIGATITARFHVAIGVAPSLTGLISAATAARVDPVIATVAPLTGLISASSTAKAVPLATEGNIFLTGRIRTHSQANAAVYLPAWLAGRAKATTRLSNGVIQPLINLRPSRITTQVRAELLRSELLEPLPPFPIAFPTQPLDHYLDLITSEHVGKPKYEQTVSLSVDAFIEDQELIVTIPGLFDLDYSHGEQEDFTGQWVGKSRWVELPNVFFSWDYEGVGWNQGNWKGPFDTNENLQRLDDYHYRLLLYATIINNHWDGSVPKAYEAWDTLFHWTGLRVIIQDYGNMTMMYGLLWDTAPDTVLLSLFSSGHMDLKPEGVELISYIYQYAPNIPFFGFDAVSDAIAGWDEGSWGTLVPPGSDYTPI